MTTYPSRVSAIDDNQHRATAEGLRHRLRALAWWREVMAVHPGGMLTVSLGSRVLGVTPARLRVLIDQERIRTVEPPESWGVDRLIVADDLLWAPTPLERGSPWHRRANADDPTPIGRVGPCGVELRTRENRTPPRPPERPGDRAG